MHFVSWDRSDRENIKLLAEEGPDVLAVFTPGVAEVTPAPPTPAETWEVSSDPESGAVARRNGREIVRTGDSLKRDKRIELDVEGRGYTFVNETSKNWIIDNSAGEKVAQFTQDHNGVRRAILEFEGETDLPTTDVVALAWISREVLETKKMVNSTFLIAFLLFLSAFVVVVFLLQ